MKFTLANLVPAALALSVMGHPVELDVRQQPCDFAVCIRTLTSQIPPFIGPCEAAEEYLNAIEQSQSQGQQPSQSDQTGLLTNGMDCIRMSIAAGFAIPNSCANCPGAPGR